ncbi:MAG: hypothetical protein HUJ80_08340, partial [Firmicutes bacterium]|nr:hypothetical protein [Bacillota bacterium]
SAEELPKTAPENDHSPLPEMKPVKARFSFAPAQPQAAEEQQVLTSPRDEELSPASADGPTALDAQTAKQAAQTPQPLDEDTAAELRKIVSELDSELLQLAEALSEQKPETAELPSGQDDQGEPTPAESPAEETTPEPAAEPEKKEEPLPAQEQSEALLTPEEEQPSEGSSYPETADEYERDNARYRKQLRARNSAQIAGMILLCGSILLTYFL